MSQVIGIDLGTTNTVVAVVRDGRAEAIADETGSTLIPSVVSFHPNGNVLVGRPAKERRIVDATSTIYSIKRLIGRSWESEEVRRARSRFPFEMREGPGQASLVVARGAGAEMHRSLGTAVFGGMLGVTLFGIFLTPVFYYVIQWLSDWQTGARPQARFGVA